MVSRSLRLATSSLGVVESGNKMSRKCPSAPKLVPDGEALQILNAAQGVLSSHVPPSRTNDAQPLACPAEAEVASSNLAGRMA